MLVTNEEQLKEDRIRQIIREEGVSNLCAPRSIFYMNELPRLGTGKIDYVGMRLVLEKNRENGAET